jgi:hypothetical protein
MAASAAERAGVLVPRVDRVIKAGGGTALLAMEQIEGSSLGQLPVQQISDDLLQRLWADVDRLHRQVERWFAELQRHCLDRGVFCSLDELTAALEG